MTLDQLTAELVKAGWSSEQVLEAQAEYDGVPVTQPILSTPPTITGTAFTTFEDKPAQKFRLTWKVMTAAIVALLFVLFSGTGVYAYLLAADKVKTDNKFLERTADQIALTVPFFPKTPKIVLTKAMISHQTVTQNSLDFSMVATSAEFQQMLGTNDLDIKLVGYTDISDPKNPKISLTGNITKDFSFEIRKKDPILYFKINKVPTLLLNMIGLSTEALEPVLANWVAYDTAPLESEARKSLEQLDQKEEQQKDPMSTMAEKMLNEDILPALVMNKEAVDGLSTYKINFKPSPFLLDKLSQTLDEEFSRSNNKQYEKVLGASTQYLTQEPKLSDVIKNLSITMWVDDDDYYVRKAEVSFNFEQPALDSDAVPSLNNLPLPTTEAQPMTVVAVVKLSNFGETINIDTPSTFITTDQFYEQLGQAVFGGSGVLGGINPSAQLAKANDVQRKSDAMMILSAVNQYSIDHSGQYPPNITAQPLEISSLQVNLCSSLVPIYMVGLPSDPASPHSGQPIKSCSEEYYTGYLIYFNSEGVVVVEAPLAETGPVKESD